MSRVVDFAAWTTCTHRVEGDQRAKRRRAGTASEGRGSRGPRHWQTPVVSGKGEQRNRGGINSGVLNESRGRSESSLAGWLTDDEDDVAGAVTSFPETK